MTVEGLDQDTFPQSYLLDMATPITAPYTPTPSGAPTNRRRFKRAMLSAPTSDAASTARRVLFEPPSRTNYVTITPLIIPLSTPGGATLFLKYDNFTGTPLGASVGAYDGHVEDAEFIVTGNGVGSNCNSSLGNPVDTPCPSSSSFEFRLDYSGPSSPNGNSYTYFVLLTLTAESGASGTLFFDMDYIGYQPFVLSIEGTDSGTGRRLQRRLQQVRPWVSRMPSCCICA